MTIRWVGCSPSNYTVGRSISPLDKIIIHWIVGTQSSCDATFADGRRQASAHYSVGQSEIHQYVKEEDTAWHAGNWSVNQTSIGIEHEGGPTIPITEAVYKQSAELVADICKRHSIPCDRDHIKKHKEVSDRVTECCGTLDIDRIVRDANAILNPVAPIDPDKVKVNLGGEWGTMEVQAIRSTLTDQKRDITALTEKVKIMDGFISQWVEELKLPVGSNFVEIGAELARILLLEDINQLYRDKIEDVVGAFDSDTALLQALQAVRTEIKTKNDMIVELQNKLDAARIPVGYKFLKSWTIFSLMWKLYKREGVA